MAILISRINTGLNFGTIVPADDVFTVKLALYETRFYSTLTFRFYGDRLLLDGEHNVAFGPTKLPQLLVRAASIK